MMDGWITAAVISRPRLRSREIMQIDIYSDTICPWCFIGKRRLERALSQRPGLDVTIRWRAFQLNPEMPAEGMDRASYYRRKFGSAQAAAEVYATMAQAGREEGIDFDFPAITRTPNTFASHRLIRYAADHDREMDMVEQLFQAYFLRGKDIGRPEVLTAIAVALGLDGAEVGRFLDGSDRDQEIHNEDLQARNAGITGVPCFIFNGRYALPGAQPPEVLHQLFDAAQDSATMTA
jgi:predicted DsbA family dithiol-disulfide isomerase